MKEHLSRPVITVVVLSICALVVAVQISNKSVAEASDQTHHTANEKGTLSLTCQISEDQDGYTALGITSEKLSHAAAAKIDFDNATGWYQGHMVISEYRVGLLRVEGNQLVVSRPSMFRRHGVMISREDFTIDRQTGAFTQTILTHDGRTLSLYKGICSEQGQDQRR